ncbi:MAG: carbon-nitrogen hydrolase family protein [Bryobacteraceae bacterium]|nr:carbon-nitrogen hydrolase family protein [Bryobacteraceae bacterium]
MRLALILFAMAASGAGGDSFVVAALQITPTAWDKEANMAKLDRFAREAAAKGAQVIVTPEGYLEGYVGNQGRSPGLTREKYMPVGEPVDGPVLKRIAALARELRVYLMAGFAESRGGAVFNTVVTFSPEGAISARYSKTHTLDDEPFNTKGVEFPVFDTPFGRWGTLICFDRQLPETARILAVKGAQMIFVPAWGSYGEMNEIMMRVRAYENGVYLAFVHPKRSMIINPKGEIIAKADPDQDRIVMSTVDLDAQKRHRAPIRFRRPDIYGDLLGK